MIKQKLIEIPDRKEIDLGFMLNHLLLPSTFRRIFPIEGGVDDISS